MIRIPTLLTLAALPLLSGCVSPAVIAGIGAAASIAGYADKFWTAGADIVAATAVACEKISSAQAAERAQVVSGLLSANAVSMPWYATLCGNLSPSNPNLNAGSAAWVAEGLTKIRLARKPVRSQ